MGYYLNTEWWDCAGVAFRSFYRKLVMGVSLSDHTKMTTSLQYVHLLNKLISRSFSTNYEEVTDY